MAEGTQLRGPSFEQQAAVDRTVEAVHDEAKPPRAGSCSLPRRFEQLEVASMHTASKKQDYLSYVRAWIRHAS